MARGAVNTPQEVNKLKGYIKNAVEAQINDEGYSMVEVLSPCPTNWGLSPLDAIKKVGTDMEPQYPLGILKNREKGAK
ncbi:hypothetical protein SDC9_210379 [bioreactor metagenome]|uniref:Thiamine pyrophosphate enzyme TPP-binding domain-containing protein n=1 Tax=bioreactor metagenome TaxID=1076179 RepID=A0A645JH00_9ZZZZ